MGHLVFSRANPVRIVRTEMEGLNYRNPENRLFHEWSEPHSRTWFQPWENQDTIYFQFESDFTEQIIQLQNYATKEIAIDHFAADSANFEDSQPVDFEDSQPVGFESSESATISRISSETTYSNYECVFPLADVASGIYRFICYFYNVNTGERAFAESELIEVNKLWKQSIGFYTIIMSPLLIVLITDLYPPFNLELRQTLINLKT